MKYLILMPIFAFVFGVVRLASAQQHSPAPPDAANAVPERTKVDPHKRQSVQLDSRNDPFFRAAREEQLKRLRAIETLVEQGKAATAKKQYALAESLYVRAQKIDPQDGSTWHLLADLYEREGKHTKALQAYRSLVYPQNWNSSIGTDPTFRMRFVLALCRSNAYPEAVQVFNKTMDESARYNTPGAVIEKAKLTGDNSEVVQYIEERSLVPLRFDPDAPDEIHLQAAAHYVLGIKQPTYEVASREEQLAHLQKAARLAPQWGIVQSALSDALKRQGRTQAAIAAQKRALALGDYSSDLERGKRATDENQRKHQLRYHPDHPEYYHYHDPNMRPTQAEVDAALIEKKKRDAANPTGAAGN